MTRRGRRLGVERYSRHWYDLAQLSVGAVAEKALRRSEVRDSVIDTKSALYAVAGVNYRQVSSGACRLSEPSLNARLEADYEAMHGAGMFEGIPPSWSTVIQRLEHLEEQINALAPDDYAP